MNFIALLTMPSRYRATSIWFRLIATLLVVAIGLQWLNDYTVLTPDHDDVDVACLLAGIAAGIVSARFGWYLGKDKTLARKGSPLLAAVGLFFVGLLAVSLFSFSATDLIMQRVDFPPSKTRTFKRQLSIVRAFRGSGKTPSWHIEVTLDNADLFIDKSDYDFMLAHRRPDDSAADTYQIAERGRFCVNVTMQQAGKALRVVHLGTTDLRAGSVVMCSGKVPG